MLTVASVNVNGVRAAVRRGMPAWLQARRPDVLTLQEVRAPDDALAQALGPGWHTVHEEAAAKGRAGVAVATRPAPRAVRTGLAPAGPGDPFDAAGRWVEADLDVVAPPPVAGTGPEVDAGGGVLTVVSAYVHTGEAGTPRQAEKLAFLDAAAARLDALAADGRHVLLTGDLNVCHREADLKNWKGNRGRSGFLPDERAWFDRLFDERGWVDVVRTHAGDRAGPYTWWSWRGKAFDLDSGWRIDHQIATPALAALVLDATVDRAASYAERWSDHAPVVVAYDLGAPAG